MTTNYESIPTSGEPGIKCPFVGMVKPDTKNLWTFCSDCAEGGISMFMGLIFVFLITGCQQGWWAALKGHAPDIHQLGQVRTISHPDVFAAYLQDVISQIHEAKDSDGNITLQTLVDMKKWIAEQEGIEMKGMMPTSKTETALLFLGGSGDLTTGKVKGDEIIKLLHSIRPEKKIVVNFSRLRAAEKMFVSGRRIYSLR